MNRETTIKIILIGLANVGKTSIARLISTFNLEYSLDTRPSTIVERFKKHIISYGINIFVMPGQKRYFIKNLEYLENIYDENSVIYYVIDSHNKKIKKETYKNIFLILETLKRIHLEKNLDRKVTIAFLAHKQDLPGSENIVLYLQPIKDIIDNYNKYFNIAMFNTSIFKPQTILNVFVQTIISRIISTHQINNIVNALQAHTQAEAISISDYNGFPLAIAGNKNLALWTAVFPIRILDITEKELKLLGTYNSHLLSLLGFHSKKPKIYFELSMNSKRLVFYINNQEPVINIALVNPKLDTSLLNGILPHIAEKTSRLLKVHGDFSWQ